MHSKRLSLLEKVVTETKKITQAILYMICKDCQPFSIVEHTGFNKLMKTVAPHYKVPSRFTIKRLINDKFELIASIMREKLSKKKCTLTTDIWMDPQTRSFLSLTVHFYDEDQDKLIFSGTIGVFMLEERHTGQNIANELKLICLEWNICEEDVIAVATDNAANITLAVEIAFGKNRHIPGFAHTLNLVTEKGIELSNDATVLIGKVKSIVTWFKHSGVASDELRKLTDKRPVQSVPTRWNSVFYMIERFLEIRPFVNQVVNQHASAPPMLSAVEIEMFSDIVDVLRPLESATSEISGQYYVTGSLAIPIAHITKQKLDCLDPKTNAGKEFHKQILKQFNTRFGNIEQVHLLAVATILDPRFKKMYFENHVAYSKHIGFIDKKIKNMDKELSAKRLATDSSSSDSELEQRPKGLFFDHNKTIQKKWRKPDDNNKNLGGEPRRLHPELSLYLGKPACFLCFVLYN
ncbi:zinc finger BED domain-containing protein 4-like [Homalodisca vitripennis]|uniref:zinc finger BED domain-containing protein 4-like n=1 Tax=Homalodisca vitripennis TaxID=197043 RepID=UPI001EEB9CE9|nr:zinc finger BED domain-containing protein 4-like [Homalodisca vitripennis]